MMFGKPALSLRGNSSSSFYTCEISFLPKAKFICIHGTISVFCFIPMTYSLISAVLITLSLLYIVTYVRSNISLTGPFQLFFISFLKTVSLPCILYSQFDSFYEISCGDFHLEPTDVLDETSSQHRIFLSRDATHLSLGSLSLRGRGIRWFSEGNMLGLHLGWPPCPSGSASCCSLG